MNKHGRKIIKRESLVTPCITLAVILAVLMTYVAVADDSGNSRDVIPPTTYITGDQAHARLFKYDDSNFTNISAANQNISPEVNAIAWNGLYWAMAARGRLWTYNGTAVTEVITPTPATPSDSIYPYAAIGSNGEGGDWLAGTLTGRGMYYDGANTPSAYLLSHSPLTSDVDNSVVTFPVQDGTKFNAGDVVQVGMEYCLVQNVLGNDLTVERGFNPMTGSADPTQAVPHPGWPGDDIDVRVAFADIISVDWDSAHGRWIVSGPTPDFSTHLFATSSSERSTDLGLTGVTKARGDYRTGDYSYYLVGGQANGGSTSKLYSYDNGTTFTDITAEIPNMELAVTIVTGGASNWLIGGQGTNILYSISEAATVFTGTPVSTATTTLVSVTAIGYGGGNTWLVAGKDSDGKARLYSYIGGTFTDLTSKMQTETQAAITTINSIVWNGTYWLIGGAGEYNVGPDVGGSVKSTDDAANAVFTGGDVDGDSSVRVGDMLDILTAEGQTPSGWTALSSSYNYTCLNLVTNTVVTLFNETVTISITYDPAQLGNIPVMRLSLYYYDPVVGTWVLVPSVVDTVNHVITANVNHFSEFQVFDDPNRQMPNTGI